MSRYAWSNNIINASGGKGGLQETRSALKAAEEWKEQCLQDNGSMFFEGRQIWTPQNFEILRESYNRSPDISEKDFMKKLEGQLRPLHEANQDDVIILMAEILWLMWLPQSPRNMRAEEKKSNIRKILSWADIKDLARVEHFLDQSYENHIANLGTWYNRRRWPESTYAIHLLHQLKEETTHLETRLATHKSFALFCDEVAKDLSRNPQFRHVIIYLLFPDDCERIFSREDKKKIIRRWSEHSHNKMTPREMDAEIAAIREKLESNSEIKELQNDQDQEHLDFYQPWIRAEWDTGYIANGKDEKQSRSKSVRSGPVPSESITGYFVIRDPNRPASTYLLHFGNHDMWKVGWAHNPEKRCADINKHIPFELLEELPNLKGCRWTLHKTQKRRNARSAQRLEQAILRELKRKKWTTDTERAKCKENAILEIWDKQVKENSPP